MRALRQALAVCALVAAVSTGASAQTGASTDDPELESSARALEGRIRAPCCWNQTLDIHSSEVSQELRQEIRSRLRAGETPEEIEADFVRRYGERILAVPHGNPLGTFATVVLVAGLLAGAGVFYLGVRWRNRARVAAASAKSAASAAAAEGAAAGAPSKTAPRDALDEQLDAELRDA